MVFSPVRRPVSKTSTSPSWSSLVDQLEGLHKTATTWFDGSRASIIQRKKKVESALNECHKYLHSYSGIYTEFEQEAARTASFLKEEYSSLRTIEEEYVNKESIQSIAALPRFVIAGAYDPYMEKKKIASVDIDERWKKFCAIESVFFVSDNLDTIENKNEMRKRKRKKMRGRVSDTSNRHIIFQSFLTHETLTLTSNEYFVKLT